MDFVDLCERFLVAEFPSADIAVLGGSTARGNRTATSDIDLLVIGDRLFDDEKSSLAASFAFDGEVIEVFAYTQGAFEEWARAGMEQLRPVIVHLLVEGFGVRGGDELGELRDRWGRLLAEGPSVTPHDLELRRYVITDLLDDLHDAEDELEQAVIAWTLFSRVAELILLSARRWLGTGKYLPRRLRELDDARARDLSAALLAGDYSTFAEEVEAELQRAGGRVHAGFTR